MNQAQTAVLPLADNALRQGSVLPVARYRFRFRMEDGLILPQYAGSLLRGQFGAALRRTACMTKAKRCSGCPLLSTCPYPAIFETPAPEAHALQKFSQVPNPYVIEPPAFPQHRIMSQAKKAYISGYDLGRTKPRNPAPILALPHFASPSRGEHPL